MKLILTDCDGVLMDWNAVFVEWMKLKGFNEIRSDVYGINERYGLNKNQSKELVKEFNNSAAIGYLRPFRDSLYYVRRMYEEHGYRFRVITSLSLNPWAIKAREENLKKYFGDAIESVVCLDTGAHKDDALAPYKDSGLFWIEDKPENVEAGMKIGLRGILIDHEHNSDYSMINVSGKLAYRAENWADVYDVVMNRGL